MLVRQLVLLPVKNLALLAYLITLYTAKAKATPQMTYLTTLKRTAKVYFLVSFDKLATKFRPIILMKREHVSYVKPTALWITP